MMGGRMLRPASPALVSACKVSANIAMDWKWECLLIVSTKFAFIRTETQRPQDTPPSIRHMPGVRSEIAQHCGPQDRNQAIDQKIILAS
jgi:hypothetical protein